MRKLLLCSISALAVACSEVWAQSPPNPFLYYGFTPTPGQWNEMFSEKADYPGFFSLSNVWTNTQTIGGAVVNGTLTMVGNLHVTGTISGSIVPLAAQFQFLIGNSLGVAAPALLTGDTTYGSAGIVWTKSGGVNIAAIATSPSVNNLIGGTVSAARMPAFSGDAVSGSGSTVLTIQPAVVTGSKIANATVTGTNVAVNTLANSTLAVMGGHTIKCNVNSGTATPQDCTTAPSQAIPAISLASGSNGGVTGNLPTSNLNSGVNSTGGFWRGDGTWAGPPGSMILLNTISGSGASFQDTTSLLSGSYSSYELVFINIIPVSSSNTPFLEVHSGGVFQVGNYTSVVYRANSAGSNQAGGTAAIILHLNVGAINTAPGFSGRLRVSNASGSASPKQWYGTTAEIDTSSIVDVAQVVGYWINNAPIDGFQFIWNVGNIASGTIKVYGIP